MSYMQKILIIIVSIVFSSSNIGSVVQPVIDFVRSYSHCNRDKTFEMALTLAEERGFKTIIETGTSRSSTALDNDGGFTIIFGYWCSLNGATLCSVDINPVSIQNARRLVTKYRDSIKFYCSDSVKFLKNFKKPIEFLYLDSYDFDSNNPLPSQTHHLCEIKAAYDKLASNAVVMIDDCDLPYGGKGKFVIEYLFEKGWKILAQDYQVIMVREL